MYGPEAHGLANPMNDDSMMGVGQACRCAFGRLRGETRFNAQA